MTRFEIALNKSVKGPAEFDFSQFNPNAKHTIRFLSEKEPDFFKYRHFKSMNMVSHCPVCDSPKGFYG
jgi:hypothetical protein